MTPALYLPYLWIAFATLPWTADDLATFRAWGLLPAGPMVAWSASSWPIWIELDDLMNGVAGLVAMVCLFLVPVSVIRFWPRSTPYVIGLVLALTAISNWALSG